MFFLCHSGKVRIEAACEMLSDKSLTIKAISEKVGYSSDVSFRRAFKRVLGISPSEFIKKFHTIRVEIKHPAVSVFHTQTAGFPILYICIFVNYNQKSINCPFRKSMPLR